MSWIDSLHHDGSARYVRGRASIGATVRLRLRAGRGAPIGRVFVRTCPDGEQSLREMAPAADSAACRWWEVDLPLAMPRTGYRFLIHAEGGAWWLNQRGMTRHTPTDAEDFAVLAGFDSPAWLRDAVFYQIFPDRFADGDPDNNVRTGEYQCYRRDVVARGWGEQPKRHAEGGGVEFFGGDLQGIAQKLDYLEELGVSALYLTPIFASPSNHKYDVADYFRIDPHFGGEPALIALRQALDARGMRLMLDMVPNHCSSAHPWFAAAQADPHAPTAEFFTFHRHPDQYESWLGVRSLPKLNYRNEHLRDIMYEGRDAVMRHWLREPYRIDGWRLDVANMLAKQGATQLGHKIGRAIRRAIKAENPEAFVLGEHFYDGTPHLQGSELDASMNYRGFTFPLLSWMAGFDMASVWGQGWADTHRLPTASFVAQLRQFASAVPWQIARQQFNLLGSHDTPRALSVMGGDVDRMRVAATLLFTYPGVPCVYYGDEIGMQGWGDPDCRRCMEWDPGAWNAPVRELYRGLIALRRASRALQEGGLQWLPAPPGADETVAYVRDAGDDAIVVVVRRERDAAAWLDVDVAGLADGTALREHFSGARAVVAGGRLGLEALPECGAQIWRTE